MANGTPSPGAREVALPAGALHAYVWECDDGRTLVMRNLLRERAITVEFDAGPERLDQTTSASGMRYTNPAGSIVFWTKGNSARLEREGASAVKCAERRAASLREDARARGVVYRALGNEPGWTLEIGPGGTLDWMTNYGQERHRFDGAIEATGGDATSRTFTAKSDVDTIEVTVRDEPCTDDAGIAYDHTATIAFAGGTLRGCAVRLN